MIRLLSLLMLPASCALCTLSTTESDLPYLGFAGITLVVGALLWMVASRRKEDNFRKALLNK